MAYGLDILADPGLSWSAGDDVLFGGPYSDVLSRFATLESGGGQYRSNPMSSARGLLHFMPDTWKGVMRNYPDLGFTPEDIDNDDKQKRAAEVMMEREIVPALRRTLGRDPTGAELYTAWVLGTPDAQKLFGADPNALASALFRPKVASSNPTIFYRDEEAMIPRTVAEVTAEYARRWSGAKPTKETSMAQQPEYDIDQGLANMSQMAERVGQMQPNMPAPQGGGNQPFGLNPYLYLAAQLMPQRKGGGWADAAMAAGAAMMQSNRPDLLGGVGAGLQAANQSMARDEEQRYRDQVGTLDLGMKLAQMGQRDDKPVVLGEGGTLVDPRTGRQIAGNPKVHEPKYEQVMEGDEIVTYEKVWNGAMMKRREVARAPRAVSDRTLVQIYDPASPTGTRLVPREQASGQAAPLPPGWSVEVDKDGKVKVVQGSMGGRPTQTDPVTGLSNEVLKELDKNLVSAQGQAMQVNRFAQQFKPIYQTIPERGRMWGTALQERMGMDPGPDAKASLAEFTRFKAEASQFFADRLKEMSGGAVTDGEAARQMAYLPTPGTGLFDGDSPSEFSAKTERLQGFFDAAAARLAYIRKAGIGISSMAELESKVPLDQVPKLIRSAIDGAKSDLAKDYPNASPETLEAYAIRRVARDFGLMDNSPLLAAPVVNPPPPSGRGDAPPPPPGASAPPKETLRVETPTPDGTGTRVQTVPVGQGDGSIPTFTDPNDPALLALPKGSEFFAPDGKGGRRLMERK